MHVKMTQHGHGALIFLHGSGGNGEEILDTLRYILLPKYGESFADLAASYNLELFTPTASQLAYPPCGNEMMNVWFKRQKDWTYYGCNGTEDLDNANRSINMIRELVTSIEDSFDYIILGGFSMGGCLALHALRQTWPTKLLGIFTIGSFLVSRSAVFTEPLGNNSPVLMMHGTEDELTRLAFAKETSKNLHARGVEVDFKTYQGIVHTISDKELEDLFDWIKNLAVR